MSLTNKGLVTSAGFDTSLVNQSAWFDGSADYMSLTYGADGRNAEGIMSMWVFRTGAYTSRNVIMQCDSQQGIIEFLTDSTLRIRHNNQDWETTAVYRDTGWYHIVTSWDTSQSGTDKVENYVNGFVPAYDANPTLGGTPDWFSNTAHHIGAGNTPSNFFNGYIAQVCALQGVSFQQGDYSITDFGESYTVGTNGSIWVPKSDAAIKAIAAAVGGDSFCLTSAIGDGTDASGNGNNYTPASMSHAANGSDNTPSKVYAILNSIAPSAADIQNGAKEYTTATAASKFGTFGLTTGKWYWELQTASSNFSAGVTNDSYTRLSSGGSSTIGLVSSTSNVFAPNATIQSDTYAYGTTSTIGFALDVDAQTLDIYVDGSLQVEIDTFTLPAPYFPAFDRNTTGTVTHTVAFDEADFLQTPPTGYNLINSANLTAPEYQGADYFNAVTYPGDGSTQSITGVGFQPDLNWIKNRDAADSHVLTDALRGVGEILSSDTTAAEATDADTVTAFDSDGFSLGADVKVNTNTENYISWNWKANGSGVANTDGTISSTVSVADAGHFSIVTFTGTGSAGTFGCGIDSPDLWIGKNTADAINWPVGGNVFDTPASDYMYLNADAAVATNTGFWNNTAQSGSVIPVGASSNTTNGSTDVMVYYVFKSIPGVCKVDSYTGNGSTDGPYVHLGFRPRWLLIKNVTTASQSWAILDLARDALNPSAAVLYANSSGAETNFATGVDILADGFKPRANNNVHNASGATLIYLAMADVAGGGALPPIPGR